MTGRDMSITPGGQNIQPVQDENNQSARGNSDFRNITDSEVKADVSARKERPYVKLETDETGCTLEGCKDGCHQCCLCLHVTCQILDCIFHIYSIFSGGHYHHHRHRSCW